MADIIYGIKQDLLPGDPSIEILQNSAEPLKQFFKTTLCGDYAAQGVGMRNIGSGIIDFTGNPVILPGSTLEKAFLYWGVMPPSGGPSDATGKINGNVIVGTLIGSPASPCWHPPIIEIYRADVTEHANLGVNTLTDFPSGSTGGENPQVVLKEPLLDGASLVLIFSNPSSIQKTIVINDGGETLSGTGLSSTTITDFTAPAAPVAKTTYIVADGQKHGTADGANFNNIIVAGPGAVTGIRPSDAFDGSDGSSAPDHDEDGLWDTLTIDVSPFVNPGDINATAAITANIDCLVYVAQVFGIETGGSCSGRGINYQEFISKNCFSDD